MLWMPLPPFRPPDFFFVAMSIPLRASRPPSHPVTEGSATRAPARGIPSKRLRPRDGSMSAQRLLNGVVTEAGHEMVVDQARGLHEGVTDRRADELETPLTKGA